MSDPIVVWHDELTLSIGLGRDGPCPEALVDALTPHMTYTHVENVPPAEQRDPLTGERRKFRFTPHDLFSFEDPVRRLVCQPGYLDRVRETAAAQGYEVEVVPVKFQGHPDCNPEAFEEDWDRLAAYFTPRARQDEAIVAIASHEYGLIDAAPAFGKTRVMGALGLLYPNARILMVVPSEAVMLTALEHVSHYIPAGEIGLIGGGHDREERFTIIIINSLMTRKWRLRPDLLLVDECHASVGDKQAEAVAVASRRARVFGFSGSLVKKFNGAHGRLEGLYGRPIFKLTNQEAQKLGLVVPIHVHWEDVIMDRNPVEHLKMDVARKRHGVWYNEARNGRIVEVANSYPADEQVLILVETVAHALELAQRLPDFRVCVRSVSDRLDAKILQTGAVHPDRVAVADAERRDLLTAFVRGDVKKLIGNDTLATGFSPDALSVLIRADGRQSDVKNVQVPGRVARVFGDKKFGIIHDFCDQFDSTFQGWALHRRRAYAARGFKQFRSRDGSEIITRTRATK